MGLMDIVKGKDERKPLRVLLYGTEGIGKTTWASHAPKPLFLGSEDGYGDLDAARLPAPHTWSEVREAFAMVMRDPHDFETLVIDTIDHLERLLWAHVCEDNGVDSIEKIPYGKGYIQALETFQAFAVGLDKLRAKRGMHVILLGHADTVNVKNPEGADYSKYALKMHAKSSAFWREWVDVLLFAQRDIVVKTTERGDRAMTARGKATGGQRVVCSDGTPAYDAKSRFKIPAEMPMDFGAFAKAIGLTPRPVEKATDKPAEQPKPAADVLTERRRKRVAECIDAGVLDAMRERHGDPDRWSHAVCDTIKGELATLGGAA